MTNRLIKLPKKGRLLIFTDLHGNLEDYKKYLDKWDSNDPDCYIVISGDFIHSIYKEDYSIEILEDIMDKYERYDNFYPLLGNHEWSHIINGNLFKANINLRLEFEKLIMEKKGYLEPYLTGYVEFFKSIPFFIQSENGIFISHAGPSNLIENYQDFKDFIKDEEYYSELVWSFLSQRPEIDYDEEDINYFLDLVKSNFMVVGHTAVNGYMIYGKQIVLSSSFSKGDKYYLDIDLSKSMNTMEDLRKCLKEL